MKLDPTPQGRILYQKFGFQSECKIERWTLRRPAGKKMPAKESIKTRDILALDREVSGADRSMLLGSLTEEAPEFTLAVREGDEILEYSFCRRGSRADHLGQWMAHDQDAATTLLDTFLRVSGRELVFVDCLSDNPWALPLVKARGCEFSRPLTRMFRGTNRYPGRIEHLCAILGPEFG